MLTRKGAKKTEILFGCNLSYTQIQKYICFLLNKNVIEKINNDGIVTYKITSHGDSFLKSVNSTLMFFR